MILSKLLKNCKIIETNVDLNVEIADIEADSRKVSENSAFVAVRGENRNGNDYIDEAINKGAAIIISDVAPNEKEIPYVLVENARETLAKMYSEYYGNPTKALNVIAITGTNGKTSTAYCLYNILRKAKRSCGLISTIDCLINDEVVDLGGGGDVCDIESAMTTPDPKKLYSLLYIMKEKGAEYVVMEASSHAIKQKKLDGIEEFDIGIFTNLSEEHLDFHKTMRDYFDTKRSLLERSKIAIINIDDSYGNKMKSLANAKSYSCHQNASFSLMIEEVDSFGSKILIKNGNKSIEVNTNINSLFGVYNLGMAISCAIMLGIDEQSIKKGAENIIVKGRLEKYKENIYIDYAHTPAATYEALMAIKSIEKDKKIVVLFGCGGNRDKEKRKEIGKIASNLADLTIITSDNARNEEPMLIIKDIMLGIDVSKPHMIIPDRKDAITYAVKHLRSNSVLVLLGKGHEEYEINKSGKHYFSERKLIDEALNND